MIPNHTDYLKQVLSYDPETGIFKRIKSGGGQKKNSIVGYMDPSHGYLVMHSKGKKLYLHRLAFIFMLDKIPEYVDHKNGDRADNRWDNLRESNQSQNLANRKPTEGRALPKGVRFNGSSYIACIMVNYRPIHLGSFPSIHEAKAAYDAAAVLYFGEYVKL